MDKADEKQLKAVIHRCPFCHEGAEAEGSVVCQGCLARHHEPCWTEAGGRCGSCGSERALAPAALPPLTVEQAGKVLRERGYTAREVAGFLTNLQGAVQPSRRRGGGWPLVLALLMLVGGVLAGIQLVSESAARHRQLDLQHAKVERLVSDENVLYGQLEAVRLRLIEVKAEREGMAPDDARQLSSSVALQVGEAEYEELLQRYDHTKLEREIQERRLRD